MSKFDSMGDNQLTVEVSMAIAKQKNPSARLIEFDYNQNCIWVENHGYHSEPLIDINSWTDMGPIVETITESLFLVKSSNPFGVCEWESLMDRCGGMPKAAAIIYLESLEKINADFKQCMDSASRHWNKLNSQAKTK